MERMERKITLVGNSLGLTLPTQMLKQSGIVKGDEVVVEIQDGQLHIKKAPTMVKLPKGVPADFFDVLEEEMQAHSKALKGLVNRYCGI